MLRFEFRLTLHVVDFMLFLVSGINCPDIGKYRHSSVDRHRQVDFNLLESFVTRFRSNLNTRKRIYHRLVICNHVIVEGNLR
jgi:hypothetical protein